MIQLQKVNCPWCSKPVHGVLKNNNEIHGECGICADVFSLPVDVTKSPKEVSNGN